MKIGDVVRFTKTDALGTVVKVDIPARGVCETRGEYVSIMGTDDDITTYPLWLFADVLEVISESAQACNMRPPVV